MWTKEERRIYMKLYRTTYQGDKKRKELEVAFKLRLKLTDHLRTIFTDSGDNWYL